MWIIVMFLEIVQNPWHVLVLELVLTVLKRKFSNCLVRICTLVEAVGTSSCAGSLALLFH